VNRDTVVYCSCTFLLGLVIGSFVVGPHLANRPGSASTPPPAMAAEGGAPTSSAGGANPMEEVRQRIGALKQQVERDPRDVEALAQLGNMYMDAAKFPDAIGYYERALAVREDPNIRIDLGICYKQNGQPEKALEAFRRAGKEAPEQWQPLYNEAVMLGEMRRLDEARAIAAKLKAMRPGDPDVERLSKALGSL
jgi:tetratricopeptide (TPR) repeat protein